MLEQMTKPNTINVKMDNSIEHNPIIMDLEYKLACARKSRSQFDIKMVELSKGKDSFMKVDRKELEKELLQNIANESQRIQQFESELCCLYEEMHKEEEDSKYCAVDSNTFETNNVTRPNHINISNPEDEIAYARELRGQNDEEITGLLLDKKEQRIKQPYSNTIGLRNSRIQSLRAESKALSQNISAYTNTRVWR